MMIKPGLVSITFRNLSPAEIVELVKKGQLAAIEWGGDVHVPHGDIEKAKEVSELTFENGLEIAAYGSYYKTGVSEGQGIYFDDVLATANALGASVIRVWAGDKGSKDVSVSQRNDMVMMCREMAKKAQQYGIDLAFEFHCSTLTDTYESTIELLERIDMPNFLSYWQPVLQCSVEENCRGLEKLLPWVRGVHCFNWLEDFTRLPLSQGQSEWAEYMQILERLERGVYAMIEFVRDDEPANFLDDAAILRQWFPAKQSILM
jgi:sugar phosphate isomerase/epimerase